MICSGFSAPTPMLLEFEMKLPARTEPIFLPNDFAIHSPEGDLALVQVAVYLALSPKSNSVYAGYNQLKVDIRETGTLPVPMHLRNAPTRLLGELGHGHGYQYDHDSEGGVALSQHLLPDELRGRQYYQPTDRGFEGELKVLLEDLRARRERARKST